jgi:hypothetical protein
VTRWCRIHGAVPSNHRCRGLSTTQRGYGWSHQKRRKYLLPRAIGKPCPLCGLVMRADQRLQLDHSTPLATNPNSIGDRIVHATCNARRGARLTTTP